MEDLTSAPYRGLDDRYKVKHLVNGIKPSALETVNDTIWASTTIVTYFEGTVDLFKTVITRQNTVSSKTNNFQSESAT